MPTRAVHTATGEFSDPGFVNPPPAGYEVVTLADGVFPDPRTQKWNGSAVVAKSPAEIAAFDAAATTSQFTVMSGQKDRLATCAQIVRARGITVWNNMTTQQKKDATLAEAAIWVGLRQFIEDAL